MATFPQSNLYKGSDMFQDFLCSTCEDNKLDKTADFYCESCMKFYCQNCINMHDLLFTKHSPFGRGDMKKWPVAKKVEDFVLKCDVHKEENLKMLCDDHNDLCCTKCAFLKHRHCRKVNFISELVKSRNTDLKKLSLSILTILKEMKELQGNQEASIRYVQSSYDEQLLTIQETRQKIIAAFNKIEQKTLKEMKDTLTKLQAASKSDGDKCIRLWDELQQLRDAIQDIGDKSNQELSFIAAKKCEDIIQQSETFLEKNSLQFKVSITFQPNSEIVQYLSNRSGLGRIEHSAQNPNKVLTLQGKSVQNVRISMDSTSCHITAICVLPDGQVIVADMDNKKIKLVDEQYQVVSHLSVTAYPKDICQITPSEVAVTVDDTNTNEVQFITVNKRQLVTGRKLQLQHTCNGIACHQEDLYITSDTALYKYKLSGKLVRKMYKDTSGKYTVSRCATAVNPTGEKLYIINFSHGKLLTLASNGSVLATFSDPALEGPRCVHVTPAGQVLVCGGGSSTILQVDIRGRRKLASLASQKDGVVSPWSVCYNRHTASMIVGLFENSSILVFKVQ